MDIAVVIPLFNGAKWIRRTLESVVLAVTVFKGFTRQSAIALKELKQQVRGVRLIERSVSDEDEPVTEVVQGYCLAVRSALSDDAHPPLNASGLKLQQRLRLIEPSLERTAQKGDYPSP